MKVIRITAFLHIKKLKKKYLPCFLNAALTELNPEEEVELDTADITDLRGNGNGNGPGTLCERNTVI